VDNKVLVVTTPTPDAILSAITKSKVISESNGDYEVAVHWGMDEARALTVLGSKAPSPILRDYKWTGKFTPFAHQKETSSFLTLNDKAFCFSQAGTGKTASVIWAADYLMKLGKVKRVLVVCPLSIMKSAWQQDLFKFAMHRSCSVAHGDAKARAKIIKAGAEFVIINFDGLQVVKDEIIAGKFDLIVADEATFLKTHTTTRWKIFNDIAKHATRLWLLTGTPAAQSPVDAFGLAKLVNPENTPRYFGSFREIGRAHV
jgi:SNF2 family DNA or RNA helicase